MTTQTWETVAREIEEAQAAKSQRCGLPSPNDQPDQPDDGASWLLRWAKKIQYYSSAMREPSRSWNTTPRAPEPVIRCGACGTIPARHCGIACPTCGALAQWWPGLGLGGER